MAGLSQWSGYKATWLKIISQWYGHTAGFFHYVMVVIIVADV